MTTTERPDAAPTLAPAHAGPTAPRAAPTAALLSVLDDALSACADADPADLHTGTAAGRAATALAALARTAAAALGAEPGTCLLAGPGVVVVRDLTAAVRLLARRAADDDGPIPASLLAAAEVRCADLLRAVTPAC
jgi:hypothetical protein